MIYRILALILIVGINTGCTSKHAPQPKQTEEEKAAIKQAQADEAAKAKAAETEKFNNAVNEKAKQIAAEEKAKKDEEEKKKTGTVKKGTTIEGVPEQTGPKPTDNPPSDNPPSDNPPNDKTTVKLDDLDGSKDPDNFFKPDNNPGLGFTQSQKTIQLITIDADKKPTLGDIDETSTFTREKDALISTASISDAQIKDIMKKLKLGSDITVTDGTAEKKLLLAPRKIALKAESTVKQLVLTVSFPRVGIKITQAIASAIKPCTDLLSDSKIEVKVEASRSSDFYKGISTKYRISEADEKKIVAGYQNAFAVAACIFANKDARTALGVDEALFAPKAIKVLVEPVDAETSVLAITTDNENPTSVVLNLKSRFHFKF